MSESPDQIPFSFEAQLELGELLLNLGRVDEACEELEKAQQLLGLSDQRPLNGDLRRTEAEKRLADALVRAKEMSLGNQRGARLAWLAVMGALLAGLLIVLGLWYLNQNSLRESSANSTRTFEDIAAQEETLSDSAARADIENTRSVREIIDQRNTIATIEADSTRIAGIAGSQEKLATAEAVATQAAGTVTAIFINQATNTPTPRNSPTPTRTPTPSVPIWDRLRILYDNTVLRSGPARSFRLVSFLNEDDEVDVLAQNGTGEWFNVQTSDGIRGWVHISVVVPLAVDSIPVAITIPPRPPTLTSTSTATLDPSLPTATPTETPTEQPTETVTPTTESAQDS